MSIGTARLVLTPLGPEALLASLEGVSQFEAHAGVHTADGLRDFLVSGEVSPTWVEALRAAKAADPWVHGFAVVETGAPPPPERFRELAWQGLSRRGAGNPSEMIQALFSEIARQPRPGRTQTHDSPPAS